MLGESPWGFQIVVLELMITLAFISDSTLRATVSSVIAFRNYVEIYEQGCIGLRLVSIIQTQMCRPCLIT